MEGLRPKGRHRMASVVYNTSESATDEGRYSSKLGKTRKMKRKLERKKTKIEKHRKKLEWLRKRKSGKDEESLSPQGSSSSHIDFAQGQSKEVARKSTFTEKSVDDSEIEYLERQLLRGRKPKGSGGRVDLLQELRSEFIKDGFEEDFLDFLSNITQHSEDTTLDRGACGDLEDEAEDEEDEEEIDTQGESAKRVRFDLPDDGNKISTDNEAPEQSYGTLKRTQIGYLNRLSEGNFTILSMEMIKLYKSLLKTGGDDEKIKLRVEKLVQELSDGIISMSVKDTNSIVSLVTIQTALITVLVNAIGINVGFIYCFKIYKVMNESLSHLFKETEDLNTHKLITRNCLLSFSALLYFEVIDVEFIFSLIKTLSKNGLNEHIAQLLITVLKHTGYIIKEYSNDALLDILGYLTTLISKHKETHGDLSNSRLRFIEQEIESFKLSKTRETLENYDFLRNLINSVLSSERAERHRILCEKFYLFVEEYEGSALPAHVILDKLNESSLVLAKQEKDISPDSTPLLLKRATKLGLHSNCQKSTFVAVVAALSPEHAVERISELGVKTKKLPEVIDTLVKTLLSEKIYNPYYLEITKALCRLPMNVGRRYKRALVTVSIVHVQNVSYLSEEKAKFFGVYFSSLIIEKILQICILKFLKTDELDSDSSISFLIGAFSTLLNHTAEDNEEYIIAQLLSLKTEVSLDMDLRLNTLSPHHSLINLQPNFSALTGVWSERLRGNLEGTSRVLKEAMNRIFV